MAKYVWSLVATVFQKYFSGSGSLQAVTYIVKVAHTHTRLLALCPGLPG